MNLKDHRIVVTPELEDPQVDFEFHEMFDFEMVCAHCFRILTNQAFAD